VKSAIVKRSIVIAGHKTSVSIEDSFWGALKDIAASRATTVAELVASVDAERRHGNLSSAVRLFVLDHFRAIAGSARETGDGTAQADDTSVGPKEIRQIRQ
jgi:predicted DNA-binding ribbon-helix-helix protein